MELATVLTAMITRVLALGAVSTAALLSAAPYAQTSTRATPTFDGIFSEGRTVGSVPSTHWLADGTLMLLDTRPPAPQRALEILDPASGARRKAFDMATAIASLHARSIATRSLAAR